jgi:hypothetical protein
MSFNSHSSSEKLVLPGNFIRHSPKSTSGNSYGLPVVIKYHDKYNQFTIVLSHEVLQRLGWKLGDYLSFDYMIEPKQIVRCSPSRMGTGWKLTKTSSISNRLKIVIGRAKETGLKILGIDRFEIKENELFLHLFDPIKDYIES